MKYDKIEKAESLSYANDNIVKKIGKKSSKIKPLDVALVGVIFCASFALVLLATSIINMAANGILAQAFTAIFAK